MSDRYVFHEENSPDAETYSSAERIAGHEDTPLVLTRAQKSRVWCILEHEVGPERAMRVLKRIEAEA